MIRSSLILALVLISSPAWSQESAATPEALSAVRVETLADEVDGGSGGIAVDADGNVFTADFGSRLGPGGTGGHRVYRITPQGEVSLFCEGIRGASGNCFDAEGNLFQSNIGGNMISRVTPDGEVTTFCDEGVVNPVGIIIDEEGTLFVGNCGSGSIQRISADGESTQFVKSNLLKCPNGITRDEAGNLYVANFYNGDIVKITPDAEASVLATLPGNNNGHLTYRAGYLYVVARTANQIYRVSLTGDVSLFAGSGTRGKDDGEPESATFSLPNDLAFSPDGQFLYVNEVGPIDGDPRTLAPTRVRRIVVAQE